VLKEMELSTTGREVTGTSQHQCPSRCWSRGDSLNAGLTKSLPGWVLCHAVSVGYVQAAPQLPPARCETQRRPGSTGLQQLCPRGSGLLKALPNPRCGDTALGCRLLKNTRDSVPHVFWM